MAGYTGEFRGAKTTRDNSRDFPLQHQGIKIFVRHRDCALARSESFHLFQLGMEPSGPNSQTWSNENLEVIPILFSPCSCSGPAADGGVHLVCSAGRSIFSGAKPPSDVIQQRLCILLHHSTAETAIAIPSMVTPTTELSLAPCPPLRYPQRLVLLLLLSRALIRLPIGPRLASRQEPLHLSRRTSPTFY